MPKAGSLRSHSDSGDTMPPTSSAQLYSKDEHTNSGDSAPSHGTKESSEKVAAGDDPGLSALSPPADRASKRRKGPHRQADFNAAPPSVLTPAGDEARASTEALIVKEQCSVEQLGFSNELESATNESSDASNSQHDGSSLSQPEPVSAGTSVTSSKYSFLTTFPPEIRTQIYDYACHWPNSRSIYAAYNREIDEYYTARRAGIARDFPVWRGCVKPLTILLLCKQITMECRPILESRFLVIDRLPPWPKGALQPVPLSKFITKKTLQAVKRLEIRFTLGQGTEGSGWFWIKMIRELVAILLEKNSFSELRIVLCVTSMDDVGVWRKDASYLCRMEKEVSITKLPFFDFDGAAAAINYITWWENEVARRKELEAQPKPVPKLTVDAFGRSIY
jgi:hypothetical protein